MIQVNLGCGDTIIIGYIGLDNHRTKACDVIGDMRHLPFKEGSISKIVCHHVLEHVDDFERCMIEIHRILKVNGNIDIKVPYFSYPVAHSPFHKLYFCWRSFEPYVELKENWNTTVAFKMIKQEYIFFKGRISYPIERLIEIIAAKYPNEYEKWLAYIFPARKLHFILEK